MQAMLQQAMSLMANNQPQQAEQLLRSESLSDLKNEEYFSLLGHSLIKQKKFSEAVKIFSLTANYFPNSANAHAELASACLSNGDHNGAEKAFGIAVKLDPNYHEAWHLLGNLQMQRGKGSLANTSFSNAQRTDPFAQQFRDVDEQMKQRNFVQAEAICRQVLQRHPNHSQALYTLAILAKQVGAFEQAIDIINTGLRYSPFHISLWRELSVNFSELGFYQKAIEACKRLIKIAPNEPEHWVSLAGNLTCLGDNKQSLQAYNKAQQLAPESANIVLQQGHMHKVLGDKEAAIKCYRECVAMDKINGAAYWALADLKAFTFESEDLNVMQKIIDSSNVAIGQKVQTGFALAKANEDNKEYELAFKQYKQANELRQNVQFDANQYSQTLQGLKNTFTPKLMSKQAIEIPQGPTPIFIVGLPRSGSTLIEQILASHSKIEGTQELFNLPRLIRNINIAGGKVNKPFPGAVDILSSQQLLSYGQAYIDQTAAYRTDKAFFIDKAPPNFQNIGLIHMILPHAIIIDARRHPMSTGMSNFKQHYASGHDFSYSLANIGHYFNEYLALMDHWQQTIPGKVLTVQYENMVHDTETQVRRLLAHINLPFEESCLKFYKNKRAVRTASSEQVRQPINSKGVEMWRNYEPYLQQLKRSLSEEILARFVKYL